MIACEKCGVWQHIKCLQKSGQVDTRKNMDDVAFVCRPCENQIVDIVNDEPQPKKVKVGHVNQELPPQLHYPQTNLFSQQPLFPQQMQQQSYPTPQQFAPPVLQQWQQQQPQQPVVNRAPFYPVTQPMKPPSLSSIHNLINSITPPSRGPSTPSSTIVEPPTPPSVRPQLTPSPPPSQTPISKVTAPVVNQNPIPVTPSNNQQSAFVIQPTTQAPISTVREPLAMPPVVTAPAAETVQVTASTPQPE